MAYSELERRRRTAARSALYVGLALTLGLLFLVLRFGSPMLDLDTDWYWWDWESMPEIQLLQGYLSVDTTSDRGSEIEGARYLAGYLEAAGIPYHLETLDDRHANLWAVIEGEERDALVLHHHIDVEPILYPDAWRWDPFGGVVDPPYIIGRGAFDMKSVGAAQLLAFVALEESGVTPRRSVIFLATSSEEVGSDLGTRWVLGQHPELRERMWGVLTEGGVLEMRDRESLKYWGVEHSQKRFADLWICGEHRERLEALREDLLDVGFPITGLRAPEEVRTFMEIYAPTRDDPELAARLSRVDEILEEPGAFLELSPYLRSFFRDEAVPFAVEDLGDGTWRLPVKLHLLPGSDPEEVRRRLVPDELLTGLTLIRGEPDPNHRSSPLDHPLFRTATDVLRGHDPEVTVGPIFLPWTTTDARFFRAAGIPTYGFSPFLFFSSETSHLAGPNERVSLPGYTTGVELYKELVGRITGVELREGIARSTDNE